MIILTTFDLDEYVYAALRAGASGFLLKDAQPSELLAAIRAVASGDAVVAPSVTRRLLTSYAHRLPTPGQPELRRAAQRLEQLTARELEVLCTSPAACRTPRSPKSCSSPRPRSRRTSAGSSPSSSLRDRVQIVVFAYETGLVTPARRLTRFV